MKISKKLIAGIIGAAGSAAPLVSDVISEKIKQKSEEKEKEKIYANQKHNGMIKNASILFSLISMVLTILSIKQSKFLLCIIGILAIISYTITFLYCLEIITEKTHNIYKITFIIGDMLMVIIATLLFF